MGQHFFQSNAIHSGFSPSAAKIIIFLFPQGGSGVLLFFVVSGFLITRMLVEHKSNFSYIDWKDFYVKRAARIFPLFLLVVGVGLFLVKMPLEWRKDGKMFCLWSGPDGFSPVFWVSLATFTFNWFLVFKIKTAGIGIYWGIFWSLAVEEQFYFTYPLWLKALGNRLKALFGLSVVILLVLGIRVLVFYFLPASALNSWQGYDSIALGALLYFAEEKLGREIDGKPSSAFWLAATGLIICCILYFNGSLLDESGQVFSPFFFSLGGALFILGGLHVQLFRHRPMEILSWPGKLSYACYLWHSAFLFLFWPLLGKIGGMDSLFVFMAGVWAMAYVSYRWFELPWNKRIRSCFGVPPSQTL